MPYFTDELAKARVALEGGDRQRAEAIFSEILAQASDEPNALVGLAQLAFQSGNLTVAEQYAWRGAKAHPTEPGFLVVLGLVCNAQNRLNEAIEHCRQAIVLAPGVAELHNNLGLVYHRLGDYPSAVQELRKSLALRPNFGAHYNLANSLVVLEQFAEAEDEFRRALVLEPDSHVVYNNLGLLLKWQGRFAEALACFDTALKIEANYVEAHCNRAKVLLMTGDFARGWPEYEWRIRTGDYRFPANFIQRWEGEPLAGRTLLVVSEQGFGDTIQFVRYVRLVKEAEPSCRIILRAPRLLHELLSTAEGVDELIDEEENIPRANYFSLLASLPGVLRTRLETIPSAVGYLRAADVLVEKWRAVLAGETRLKVGIAWQGSQTFRGDRYRSIPLTQFVPLTTRRNTRFYSLQKNVGQEQLAALGKDCIIDDLGAKLDLGADAFVDTAAVMMHLDLVISSDTAIAHLAGALGVPVWVALPHVADWRWLVDRNGSPWYPSMRLFRQTAFGDWTTVFARIAAELLSFRPPSR